MSQENSTLAAPITVGLPPGISADAVLARKKAMIEAGTDPLIAEKLAIDCEVQQARRDALNKASDAAAAARNNPPAAASTDINSMTVAQLTDLAAQRGVDLAGASKKADIIAALQAQEATK